VSIPSIDVTKRSLWSGNFRVLVCLSCPRDITLSISGDYNNNDNLQFYDLWLVLLNPVFLCYCIVAIVYNSAELQIKAYLWFGCILHTTSKETVHDSSVATQLYWECRAQHSLIFGYPYRYLPWAASRSRCCLMTSTVTCVQPMRRNSPPLPTLRWQSPMTSTHTWTNRTCSYSVRQVLHVHSIEHFCCVNSQRDVGKFSAK